jgi:dTDP-4-amino-4,6-dideoxygalactose transaminase
MAYISQIDTIFSGISVSSSRESMAIGASSDAGCASDRSRSAGRHRSAAQARYSDHRSLSPCTSPDVLHDLYPDSYLPRTEEFARRELTLPLHPRMIPATVELVVNALAAALGADFPVEAIA